MPRRMLKQARVLITGASSGIGWHLARQLADRQARLLITARREERLRRLANQLARQGASIDWRSGDITEAGHRKQLVAAIQEQWGALDLLINNAGIGAVGRFDQASPARLRRVMEVNFFAPIELTRQCLPLLRQADRPAIVNIGSVLAHAAVPYKSEYCASKFALRGWNDALRAELSADRIEVLLVNPSTTSSEFFDQAIDRPKMRPAARWSMPAEQVARATIRAIESRRRELILSPGGRALVWGSRMAPPLLRWVLQHMRPPNDTEPS